MTANENNPLQLLKHLFLFTSGLQLPVALLVHIPAMANGDNRNKYDNQKNS